MIRKLLIANRGEIALRIMRTARAVGIRTVAVYSDADRKMFHVEQADEAVHIGASPAGESYLDQRAILAAASRTGADAIHPGYGFLSENPDFAEAVEAAGLIFVGPPSAAMRALGHKDEAKRLMREAGIPVVPGYEGPDQSPERLAVEARRVGYPLLVKPVAGGGGKGMRLISSADELPQQLAAARREAASAFGDDRVLIERHLFKVRHIEVQVMADRHGNAIHLWERDCSAQRRHQKVIEEAPAPHLSGELRRKMCEAAVRAARQVGYVGVGTVEFLLPVDKEAFFFIEMNTRLQVEHRVTEAITGLDLVALQLRVAAGEVLGLAQDDIPRHGHAIELRLYAEDPAQAFRPQTGDVTALDIPEGEGLRFDGGIRAGDHVTAYYDPMIGKLIAHGPSREVALLRLQDALARTHVGGLRTNLGLLARLLKMDDFAKAALDTRMIDDNLDRLIAPLAPGMEVVAAAVLAFEGRLSTAPSASPFHELRGFQIWGSDPPTCRLMCDGGGIAVAFSERGRTFRIGSGGSSLDFNLVRVMPPGLWIECEGKTCHLRFHFEGEDVLIIGPDGQRFRFSRDVPVAAEVSGEQNRLVTAPVPGLLARHLISSGEDVREGDLVAVVEAMKTEFGLKAEAAGKIAFHVPQGSQVKEGDVVAEIGARDE